MRRQGITVLAAILLGGMALAVSGCGSKSHPKAAAGSANVAPATQTTTTTSTPPTSVPPSLGLLTSKNCQQLYNLGTAFSSALTGAGQNLQKTGALLKQFADQTPSAIRPDFEVLVAAYTKVAAALKGVNLSSGQVPSANVIAKLSKLSSQINVAQVQQASTNISAWATKNCTTK